MAGKQSLNIWCMSDSYLDIDKEVQFEVNIKESENNIDEENAMNM